MANNRGVKKVSEKIIQDGRALVITDEDLTHYAWEDLPNGTLKVNPKTGIIEQKLEGQTNWLPYGIKNDNTLCIAKDSMIITETFEITNPNDGDGNFTYKNKNGDYRHMPITSDGYMFELEEGSYIKRRNHLTVVIDDVLERSAASGGLIELTENRFIVTDKLEKGHEITAKYVRIFRMGNPYPRVFMDEIEPEAAEVGDLWIDLDGTLADNDIVGEDIEVRERITSLLNVVNTICPKESSITDADKESIKAKVADFIAQLKKQYPGVQFRDDVVSIVAAGYGGMIPWSMIAHPTTMNGYGITDSYASNMRAHTHAVQDVANLDSTINTRIAQSTSTTNISGHYVGDAAGNILLLDSNGKIPSTVWDRNIKGSALDKFTKGMIMDWYGAADKVPAGWHICDGTNNTPDLRDKFVVGAGKGYNLSDVGGEEKHVLLEEELPSHEHFLQTNTEKIKLADNKDQTVPETGFIVPYSSASTTAKTTTLQVGQDKAHENRPPYYALFKIMKL